MPRFLAPFPLMLALAVPMALPAAHAGAPDGMRHVVAAGQETTGGADEGDEAVADDNGGNGGLINGNGGSGGNGDDGDSGGQGGMFFGNGGNGGDGVGTGQGGMFFGNGGNGGAGGPGGRRN